MRQQWLVDVIFDIWSENSSSFHLNINVVDFARKDVKWDLFVGFSSTVGKWYKTNYYLFRTFKKTCQKPFKNTLGIILDHVIYYLVKYFVFLHGYRRNPLTYRNCGIYPRWEELTAIRFAKSKKIDVFWRFFFRAKWANRRSPPNFNFRAKRLVNTLPVSIRSQSQWCEGCVTSETSLRFCLLRILYQPNTTVIGSNIKSARHNWPRVANCHGPRSVIVVLVFQSLVS